MTEQHFHNINNFGAFSFTLSHFRSTILCLYSVSSSLLHPHHIVPFVNLFIMAFAAAMGVDFAISGITMAAALAPVEEKPVARIGIGSTMLGATEDARTNGVMPNLYLYDVHGKMFAKHGMF